jgi:tetratricopeptide (TPR) repeat protein
MAQSVIRRVLFAIGATLLAVGAGLAWSSVRSEREFRRLLASGEQATASHQTLEAIEAYSGALALRPESMVAHLKRGDSYRTRGEFEPALRDLRDAAALDSTAPQPVELLADVNFSMGRYDRAIDLYRQFLALDERAPRVLYKLGLAYYRARRAAAAIDPLRRALAFDDRLSEAHYLLGIALREEKRPRDGIRALRQAVALNPGLIAAREALADAYRTLGTPRDQLEQLEAIAALEPERPERLVSVAEAYARAGRAEAAITALDRLGDELPEDGALRTEVARAWLTVAAARKDRALTSRATDILEPMASRADAPGDVLALLGQSQLLAGDVASAERTLQRAVARLPVSRTAFLDLAESAERLRHLRTARSALIDFTSLADDEDDRRRAAQRVADLSLRLNEPATAADWARRASDEARPSASALATLATAELRLGHAAAAKDALTRGLNVSPRHAALLALRRQLGP